MGNTGTMTRTMNATTTTTTRTRMKSPNPSSQLRPFLPLLSILLLTVPQFSLSFTTPSSTFVPIRTSIPHPFASSTQSQSPATTSSSSVTSVSSSTRDDESNQPTELPDSLEDAATIAAEACASFAGVMAGGPPPRCRVDFDTSVGDETYTTLKSSTEFCQKFVTALCYEMIPGLMEMRQEEMMRVVEARSQLRDLADGVGVGDGDGEDENENEEEKTAKIAQLNEILQNGGRNPDQKWKGPTVRIYFPDEGSAALARRDWNPLASSAEDALVPPCVQFSSCGGVPRAEDMEGNDAILIFFCPRASEAEFVEKVLYDAEERGAEKLKLTIFVNPLLVDMGVTGFGMAGRMLRERLIDDLVPAYYLRTLQWGALTRLWPRQFTVWQEDEAAEGGYRLIKSMNRLPSNPEVEDIYDYENGVANDPEQQKGFGFLDAIGDFVQGMTRL